MEQLPGFLRECQGFVKFYPIDLFELVEPPGQGIVHLKDSFSWKPLQRLCHLYFSAGQLQPGEITGVGTNQFSTHFLAVNLVDDGNTPVDIEVDWARREVNAKKRDLPPEPIQDEPTGKLPRGDMTFLHNEFGVDAEQNVRNPVVVGAETGIGPEGIAGVAVF